MNDHIKEILGRLEVIRKRPDLTYEQIVEIQKIQEEIAKYETTYKAVSLTSDCTLPRYK